jgi:hypothetical protein
MHGRISQSRPNLSGATLRIGNKLAPGRNFVIFAGPKLCKPPERHAPQRAAITTVANPAIRCLFIADLEIS